MQGNIGKSDTKMHGVQSIFQYLGTACMTLSFNLLDFVKQRCEVRLETVILKCMVCRAFSNI
jgi:hypothetical protein